MADSDNYDFQSSSLITQYNSIVNTLNKTMQTPGISKDLLEQCHSLQSKLTISKKELDTKIATIRSTQTQNTSGDALKDFFNKFETFLNESSELFKTGETDSTFVTKVKQTSEINKDDFYKALNHHKWLSYIHGLILFIVVGCSLLYIWFTFIHVSENFDDIKNLVESITSLKEKPEFLVQLIFLKIFLKIIGRISILSILTGLIFFVGKLHSGHVNQYESYQNKISGLSTAELIITAANSSTREKILLIMTDTYLTINTKTMKQTQDDTFVKKVVKNFIQPNS